MNKIVLTRGIPASGKTTFARRWVEEDPENRVRINMDDIRNMLGPYWVPNREKLVRAIKEESLWSAMIFHKDIILDNMNLNLHELSYVHQAIETLIKSEGYTYIIEFIDFKTPLDVCIDRDSKREHSIGEQVITEIYNKYKDFYESSL